MSTRYTFGRFEVRPDQRLVLVDGRPAELGARAFDLLLCLIEQRQRVVTKAELLDLVWPEVVVEENNLSVQVSALRKLLGRGVIATLPGRGYRFAAELASDSAPAATAPTSPRHRRGTPSSRQRVSDLPACSSAANRSWRSCRRPCSRQARGLGGWCCWPARAAWARHSWRSNWPGRPKPRARPCCGAAAWKKRGAPPYWPWRQLIRGYLRGRTRCRSGRSCSAAAWTTSPASSRRWPSGLRCRPTRPSPADSTQSRFRLFDAVAGFWRQAARQGPLLLIFEDLHWADATSLRLFSFLAHELADSALLVVGTYRDTELSRQHPLFDTLAELARTDLCQRIELRGLSVQETEEFAAAAGGGLASAALVSALYKRTEGHPLFLERNPALHDRCARAARRWTPAGDAPPTADRHPHRRARGHRQAPEPPVGVGGQEPVGGRLHRPHLRSRTAVRTGTRQVRGRAAAGTGRSAGRAPDRKRCRTATTCASATP